MPTRPSWRVISPTLPPPTAGRSARAHQLLVTGVRANAYYVLESGVARAYVHDLAGREITTELYGPGQIVIEVDSLFQRTPARSYLETLTEAILWRIEFADFQELFHRLEGFREWGRAYMAGELFALKQRMIDRHTRSATERYLGLLAAQPDIVAHAPLKYVASYLGITDTSLSRVRREIAAGR